MPFPVLARWASLAHDWADRRQPPPSLQITTVVHEKPVEAATAALPRLSLEGQRPNPVDFTPGGTPEASRRFGRPWAPSRAGPTSFTRASTAHAVAGPHLPALEAPAADHPEGVENRGGQTRCWWRLCSLMSCKRAKPGEDLPLRPVRPVQDPWPRPALGGGTGSSGLAAPDASEAEWVAAREKLLGSRKHVALLGGPSSLALHDSASPPTTLLEASARPRDAKASGPPLAYLHNGSSTIRPGFSVHEDPALCMALILQHLQAKRSERWI